MTCGPLTLLAKLSDARLLERCTCGCLHLVWDNATVYLDERDLGSVVRHLHTAFPAPGADVTLTAQGGEVQVWLLRVGFRLTPDEFRAFREMLARALEALRDLPRTHPHSGDTPAPACLLN